MYTLVLYNAIYNLLVKDCEKEKEKGKGKRREHEREEGKLRE